MCGATGGGGRACATSSSPASGPTSTRRCGSVDLARLDALDHLPDRGARRLAELDDLDAEAGGKRVALRAHRVDDTHHDHLARDVLVVVVELERQGRADLPRVDARDLGVQE